MGDLWCVTAFFNPCGYKSLTRNWSIFAEQLKRHKVNLMTVELAFGEDGYCLPEGPTVKRLRSQSVCWQKERLINHAVSLLPESCDRFAWLDCDILFPVDNWAEILHQKLDKADIVQVFKKVNFLPAGVTEIVPGKWPCLQGVTWQKIIHKNWLARRTSKELPFSHPGFGWAAKRDVFAKLGIYDRNIVGSGDTFMVDCFFDSWEIHGYAAKFTEPMKAHMMDYCKQFRARDYKYDFVPLDIYHLWHGSPKNRGYMSRHDLVINNNYDPATDVKQVGDVFEWASDKPALHQGLREYFYSRQEDDNDV